MYLRRATQEDIPELAVLFRDTIMAINSRDYTPEQVKAWAATSERTESLSRRIDSQHFMVAVTESDKLAGFASIEAPDYLDLMYVSKDFQRQGVGSLLMKDMIKFAVENDFRQITSDVSVTARPLFEAFGFHCVADQWPEIGGIVMPNFKMLLEL